jgi:hypothetical protein
MGEMINMSADATGFMLAILVIGISFIAVRAKNIIISIVAAGAWAGLLSYLIYNPPASLPAGGNVQQILIIVMAGAAIGFFLHGIINFVSDRRERNAEVNYYSNKEDATPRSYSNYEASVERKAHNNGGDESLESYRKRIRAKARPWEGRRA